MNNDKIKKYLIDYFEKTNFKDGLTNAFYWQDGGFEECNDSKYKKYNTRICRKTITKNKITFIYFDNTFDSPGTFDINITIDLDKNNCHFYGHHYYYSCYVDYNNPKDHYYPESNPYDLDDDEISRLYLEPDGFEIDTTDVNEFIKRWNTDKYSTWVTNEAFPKMKLFATNFVDNTPIKDFIYKVNDSNKLKIQSNYDSIDEFFNDTNDESFENHESISIITVDTKVPIVKIEKTQNETDNTYKFIVDITNENGDDYIVRSIIDTKEKLEQLLKSTIDSLKNYPQFSKYAEDLEDCL